MKKKEKTGMAEGQGRPLFWAVASNLEDYDDMPEPGVRLFHTEQAARFWAANVVRHSDPEWAARLAETGCTSDESVMDHFQLDLGPTEFFEVMPILPAYQADGETVDSPAA
jgi:hypothetical protein